MTIAFWCVLLAALLPLGASADTAAPTPASDCVVLVHGLGRSEASLLLREHGLDDGPGFLTSLRQAELDRSEPREGLLFLASRPPGVAITLPAVE